MENHVDSLPPVLHQRLRTYLCRCRPADAHRPHVRCGHRPADGRPRRPHAVEVGHLPPVAHLRRHPLRPHLRPAALHARLRSRGQAHLGLFALSAHDGLLHRRERALRLAARRDDRRRQREEPVLVVPHGGCLCHGLHHPAVVPLPAEDGGRHRAAPVCRAGCLLRRACRCGHAGLRSADEGAPEAHPRREVLVQAVCRPLPQQAVDLPDTHRHLHQLLQRLPLCRGWLYV